MWGLLLLFFAAAYFAVVGLLLFKVKPIWGKALVLIAAILIPNADDWYYRNQLADYCKTEAGIKVYRQVSRKEGLVAAEASIDGSALKRFQVSYLEWPETIGAKVVGYWRIDRFKSGGRSERYKIPEYTALYEIKRTELDSGRFIEVIEKIVARNNGTILGEFKGLFYYGGWYPRAIVGRGGLVAGCGKGSQVISRKDWGKRDMTQYSINEVVSQVFSRE